MQNKNFRKNVTKGAAIACAAVMAVGTLAYFTDRVESNASVTGGTVGISEDATTNWTTQLQDGPQDIDNINPGDSRSLAFTVTNTGTKAVDVRHTIKLNVIDAEGNAKTLSSGTDVNGETLLQFDIFKASDVTTMSNASGNVGYVLADGAEPVFSSDSVNDTTKMGAKRDDTKIANGVVSYYFADSVLDGVGTAAETGYKKADQNTVALNDTDVASLPTDSSVKYDYVLIFRDTTLNDFQGCKVHAELVVEAKQHLNTNSSWQNVETVTYDMNVGGLDPQKVTIDTAPNNQTGVLETVTDGSASTYNGTDPH